jgi:hypothetical protein
MDEQTEARLIQLELTEAEAQHLLYALEASAVMMRWLSHQDVQQITQDQGIPSTQRARILTELGELANKVHHALDEVTLQTN